MRDRRLELRLSGPEEDSYKAFAARDGLSVSVYVRRCVDESQQLQRSLDEQREAEETKAAFYQSQRH
jgi:hypothetical protein